MIHHAFAFRVPGKQMMLVMRGQVKEKELLVFATLHKDCKVAHPHTARLLSLACARPAGAPPSTCLHLRLWDAWMHTVWRHAQAMCSASLMEILQAAWYV